MQLTNETRLRDLLTRVRFLGERRLRDAKEEN
jgi:hypothetical protein